MISIFLNFCQGGERAKNAPKWQKNLSVLHLLFQESYIIWSPFIIHMCKRLISPGIFFSFCQNIDFWDHLRGDVKGQKMTQSDKKSCLSHIISQELNIIWFRFLVHKCKMMISSEVFFIFSKFWFFWFVVE